MLARAELDRDECQMALLDPAYGRHRPPPQTSVASNWRQLISRQQPPAGGVCIPASVHCGWCIAALIVPAVVPFLSAWLLPPTARAFFFFF